MNELSSYLFNLTIERIQHCYPGVTWTPGSDDTITQEGMHCFFPDEVDVLNVYEIAMNKKYSNIYVYRSEPC